MVENKIIILIVLALLGIVFGVVAAVSRQRLVKKQSRFADRESVTPDEIYSRYFASLGLPRHQVLHIWNYVATILKLDDTRLRPSDRFDTELAPVKGYSSAQDETEDLEQYFDDRCKELMIDPREQHVETLGDLIVVLCGRKSSGFTKGANQ